MIVLLSVILLAETKAADCAEASVKESYQTGNRIEDGIVSYHFGTCFIRFCDTSYGEILEPGVFPVN